MGSFVSSGRLKAHAGEMPGSASEYMPWRCHSSEKIVLTGGEGRGSCIDNPRGPCSGVLNLPALLQSWAVVVIGSRYERPLLEEEIFSSSQVTFS